MSGPASVALVLLVMTPLAIDMRAEQVQMILVSVREGGTDSPSVMLTEDPRGVRALRVYLPSGRNVGGRTPERIRLAEIAVQAFDDSDTAFVLTPLMKVDGIPGVCNAGSCNAIADFGLGASNAESDRLRRVVVVVKGTRYELEMTKPPER